MTGKRSNLTRVFLTTVFAVIFSPAASAQTPEPLLVEPNWLSDHLADRNLVLLHVGGRADYDSEHIRGARLISDGDITRSGPTAMYDLPEAADLRNKLQSLGISDDSRIVVYVGRGGVPSATRVIYTLDYIGLGDRTSFLNGGIIGWKAAGKEVTNVAPAAPTPGRLSSKPVKAVVADANLVKSIPTRAGYKLIDARAPVYYQGIEASHNKFGHIPGAVNIPFTDVSDTQFRINVDRLAEIFQRAGVARGDTVVAYCHIGQQGTAVVFAARLLGHTVLLYDGSMHNWEEINGPVEK